MKQYEMERVNGSFARTMSGEIATPLPTVRLIRSRGEFSAFLMDRTLFFDGRFAFYDKYEGGDFFETHDLIALIVRGERELVSVTEEGDSWVIALAHLEGDIHTMYFITLPKSDKTKARLA